MRTRWRICSAPIWKGSDEAEPGTAGVQRRKRPFSRKATACFHISALSVRLEQFTCRFPQRRVSRRWLPLLAGHPFRQFGKKLVVAVAGVGLDEIDGKRDGTAAFDAVDVELPLFAPLPDGVGDSGYLAIVQRDLA